MPLLEALVQDPEVIGSGRVRLGLGFDLYHLSETQIKEVFWKARGAEIKLITSHWRRNNVAGKSCSLSHAPCHVLTATGGRLRSEPAETVRLAGLRDPPLPRHRVNR